MGLAKMLNATTKMEILSKFSRLRRRTSNWFQEEKFLPDERGMGAQLGDGFPILNEQHLQSTGGIPDQLLIGTLKKSGALILRNVVRDKGEFTRLTKRFAPGEERGVVRSDSSLEFHGELYSSGRPPDILWFYCERPAGTGGETLLCDGAAIAASLRPETIEFFTKTPLVYERVFGRKAWVVRYATEDKQKILSELQSQNTAATFLGDTLHTRFETNALRQTKWGREQAFINSLLHALDSNRRGDVANYGLKTVIPDSIVSEVRNLTARHAYPIHWQSGDTVVIDNTRVMHGRRRFQGRREIVAVNGICTAETDRLMAQS
jgi:alpha-ketoglutarate-dependent taurine dioxygenase